MGKGSHIHEWKILGRSAMTIFIGCEAPGCNALFGLEGEEAKLFEKAKRKKEKLITITDDQGVVHEGR